MTRFWNWLKSLFIPKAIKESSPVPVQGEAEKTVPNVPPPPPPAPTVPWHMVVLLLDNLDTVNKADIPLKELTSFLKRYSRFALKLTFITFNDPHAYTGPNGDNRYDLHWSSLPQKWLNQIPPCSSVLALYKLNGKLPVHAGSTWSLPYGIPVNGKLRTYSAVPVDLWFYNNDPYEGFNSRGAQILAHETVNAIQGKLEAPPYSLGQLIGTPGDPAIKYESDRLACITPAWYTVLGNNDD